VGEPVAGKRKIVFGQFLGFLCERVQKENPITQRRIQNTDIARPNNTEFKQMIAKISADRHAEMRTLFRKHF